MKRVLVSELPECDICRIEGYDPVRKARYNSPTRMGKWANLCTTHFRDHGYGQTAMVEKFEVRK